MKNLKYALVGLSLAALTVACDDAAEELTSVDYARIFSPNKLEAKSVKESSADLSWNPAAGATAYLIEVFADDSLSFAGAPAVTKTVSETKYKLTGLVYDTDYSVKVRALDEVNTSRNSNSSTLWFKTSAQQILNSLKEENIADRSVTVSWPVEETDVTLLKVIDESESTVAEHTITDDEKTAGKATVTGIEPETKYTVKLYYVNENNIQKERGSKTFTTIADLAGAILVHAEDNLKDIVDAAEDGAVLALYGGTFMIPSSAETPENAGALAINKNLVIKGIFPTNIPTIQGRFEINNGASLSLNQVIVDGDINATGDQCFNFKGTENMGSLIVENAEVKNFIKGVYYLNVVASIPEISFKNCLIHDIVCDGGDMFDSRKGHIGALNFINCTMYNSCAARDVFRYDDAANAFSGAPSVVTIENCTLNGLGDGGKRLLYIRYGGNLDPKATTIVWKNNIVSNTGAVWTNQATTAEPTFSNNVYFNCAKLNVLDGADGGKTNMFVDADGKNLDPKYKDAANGDFTLGNEDVTKLGVGDSRWR